MALYNNCGDIYNTNLTRNNMCNIPHYVGKEPYGIYNDLGELQGYFWNYGESIRLNFFIDGEITVENDAIVYTAYGDAPSTTTEGYIGRKAYNVRDMICWTCVSIIGEDSGEFTYIWEQDSSFTYPTNGGKEVYVTAKDYLKGKLAKVELYNFRYEKVLERTLPASTQVTFEIDQETSKEIQRGNYYLTLQVADELSLTYIYLIKDKDCIIMVK